MFSFRRKQKDIRSCKGTPYFIPATQGHEKRFFQENVQRYFGQDAELRKAVDTNNGNEGFFLHTEIGDELKKHLVNRMRDDSQREYRRWLDQREENIKGQRLALQLRDLWANGKDFHYLSPPGDEAGTSYYELPKRPCSMPTSATWDSSMLTTSNLYSPPSPHYYPDSPIEDETMWGPSEFYNEKLGLEPYHDQVPELRIRAPTLVTTPPPRRPLRMTRSAETLDTAHWDHWNVPNFH